jgi:hypothetical protein
VEATVVATSEETRYWWEAGPGADLDIEGLGRAVAKTAGELKAALDRRRTVFAAWQEAAAKELAEVEQELRAQTRLDAGQDLLRDQREIARTRFEQVDADRERYLLDVDRLDRALETRKGLLAYLEAVQDQISATREAHLAPLNEQLAEVGGEQMRITVQRGHQADREDVERYLEDGPVLTLERAGRYKTRRVASRLTKMARPTDLSMALVESDCGNLGNELAVGVGDALDEEEATKPSKTVSGARRTQMQTLTFLTQKPWIPSSNSPSGASMIGSASCSTTSRSMSFRPGNGVAPCFRSSPSQRPIR